MCQEALVGQTVVTDKIDNGDYPGGYYQVVHLLVDDSISQSVLRIRVFNVALGAALLGAVALITTATVRRLMVIAIAATLIPLGWFVLASVNPSSWALSGLTALGFALHTLYLLDGRRRLAAGAISIVSLAVALASRGDAAAFAGVIVVAVSILHWRTLWTDRRLLALPILTCLVCVWRLLIAAQVANIAGASAESDRSADDVALGLLLEFPALFSGMFGYSFGLGWIDTPVHALTAYPMTLVIGFLVITGLGRMSLGKAIAAAAVVVPMIAIPLMTLYRQRLIVGENVQPRYLLPLIPMLLAILLTDKTADRSVSLSRVQSVFIWMTLTVATTAGIYANARRYVTGTDGSTVIDDLEWWWGAAPSPTAVTLIGGLAFAVFAAPMITMDWRRPVDLPGEQPDELTTVRVEEVA